MQADTEVFTVESDQVDEPEIRLGSEAELGSDGVDGSCFRSIERRDDRSISSSVVPGFQRLL